jgi:hypothetical protein
MEEKEFREYLRKGGRSKNAVERCIRLTSEFEDYVRTKGKELQDVDFDDVIGFVDTIEQERGRSAKTHLWALIYYFGFVAQVHLKDLAWDLRQERIKRRPFQLAGFRVINDEFLERLAAVGITDIQQMVAAGSTSQSRVQLSQKSGIDESKILELTKLSDLARIPGIKGIRARLYFDAGIDTLDNLAKADPDLLRDHLLEFVDKTGFDGIAPTPGEIEYSIEKAQTLDRLVEYDH